MQFLLLNFGERTIGRALCVTFRKATVSQAPLETLGYWCQLALPALVSSMQTVVSLIFKVLLH